jgi:putative transposase
MERFIQELRRGTKVRGRSKAYLAHKFPSEGAVYKLLYLGHGLQPVSLVGEARRKVGGAKAQGFFEARETLEKMLQERYAPRTQTLTHTS